MSVTKKKLLRELKKTRFGKMVGSCILLFYIFIPPQVAPNKNIKYIVRRHALKSHSSPYIQSSCVPAQILDDNFFPEFII